ncbi:MAG TPA: DinB family protein [Anaerolineales bacterium]|nr:DinB family protein [Anaerolineales bacterium]HLO29974.1 DinB family protein [Anaerolineales bacterium]
MQFETLYQELVDSTEMIRALLLNITQEEARTRPTAEAWSILEVICHLYDEEREDFREHLDFILSTSLKAGLHRQNEEWHSIDPQGWVLQRKYNEQDFAEMQNNFFVERQKSLEWLKSLSNPNWETAHTSQFGSLQAGDMFASWVAHDNLHIRQLVELRRMKIENITRPYKIEYAGDW